ncbi:protein INCREASED PETAL GROWTH ANISOTROPY 1-like isoform X2 [Euphorbia lathyris]
MVVALVCTHIEDVLKFVDWLDDQLSTLADERAVSKHFNWPEKKADAIREAAIEYHDLKQLDREITSFEDDTSIPYGTALKKTALLLDKSERGMVRLIKLRSSALRTYQDWKIPTNWMLDS